MEKNTAYLKVISGILGVLAILIGYSAFKGQGLVGSGGYITDGGGSEANFSVSTASTSPVFLSSIGTAGATATSTSIINVDGIESVDLNLQYVASSTTSQLVWILEFSNNGIDWYNEDVASVAGSIVTHNATATSTPALTMHSWTPGAIGNPQVPFMKNTTITPISTKYMRVSFSSWIANGSLWFEIK